MKPRVYSPDPLVHSHAPGYPWLCALLVVPALVSGCQNRCAGPSCEDAWPAARVALHRGGAWTDPIDGWDDAAAVLIGTLDEGSDWAVDGTGDHVWIGQPDADRVVKAVVPVAGLREQPLTVVASWEAPASRFGSAVRVIEGDLWVGAVGADLDRGRVWVFRHALEAEGPHTTGDAELVVVGASPGDRLGTSVIACGDLTGDGLPDAILTMPRFSAPADGPLAGVGVPSLAGAIVVVRSELSPSGELAPWEVGPVLWGDGPGAAAGTAVACDADLTGDGAVDLAIGAPFAGTDDVGVVRIVSGVALTDALVGDDALAENLAASGPLVSKAAVSLPGPDASAWAGASLATGDVDGDGTVELMVGAPGLTAGRGGVLLYAGADLLAGAPEGHRLAFVASRARDPGDHVGRTVATGDVDGDGRVDLLVGAPDWRNGDAFDAGLVALWRGHTNALGTGEGAWPALGEVGADDDVTIVGVQPFQRVGQSIVVDDLAGSSGADDVLLPTRARARR